MNRKNPLFSLILLFTFLSFVSCNTQSEKIKKQNFDFDRGGIVRGDKNKKEIALVFTGDEFADGGMHIVSVLNEHKIKASFFFTGNFYSNPDFAELIETLVSGKHYVGAHSDKHLLYCDWDKRDSLLVTKEEFFKDLNDNYMKMNQFGIDKKNTKFFLPAFEWYNDSISSWTKEAGLQLVNLTHGTLSNADYTTPEMKNYRSSDLIYNSILDYEKNDPSGLNGFILLSHIGTDPGRTDKFYYKLDSLIKTIKSKGYTFKRIDALLATN